MDLVMQDEQRVSIDMSGMGGSYEQGCQRMLWLGLQKLDAWPTSVWEGIHGFKGVYGLLHTEGDELKDLETEWSQDPEISKGGMTGAMHQCVIQHLHQIHINGYRWWIDAIPEERHLLIVDPPVVEIVDPPVVEKE